MRGFDAGDRTIKLTDNLGNPLYLFLLDGRPATDSTGSPLLNIIGNSLISFVFSDEPSCYQDWKGFPLTDSNGKTHDNKDYAPTRPPISVYKKNFKCNTQVFSLDGFPLTDSFGVPLLNIDGRIQLIFSPKGHPVMDTDGNNVTDKCGRVLFQDQKPFLSENKVPLRVYDDLGRPLTDENGFPLTNILGLPLIVSDEFRNPVKTIKGYPVKDSEGHLQWETGYNLTKTPKYFKMNKAILCKNDEHAIAFDVYGHPLTDMHGFPLFDLEGNQLVKKKKIWLDTYSNSVTIIQKSTYDRDEVARLRNSKGVPVRLYDKRGYPLTDHEGVPLVHASGVILLKFNEQGEPFSDWKGDRVFDDMGNHLGTKMFRPSKVSGHNEFVANHTGYGIQVFEASGMPLTNIRGVPLLNKYHELMAVLNLNGVPVQDVKGRDVYDILGLPIVTSLSKPLLDPTGHPIRLYSRSSKPLTDRCGNVLKSINSEYLLKLNFIGQIVSDSKGGPLYDSQGCPMGIIDKFLSFKPNKDINYKILINLDGSPLCLYDIAGEPLTDAFGGVLVDSSGKSLITSSSMGIITEKNGQPAYDLDGHMAVKVAGRAVTTKMAVYDEHDRPLIGPSGFILKLRSGRELLKFDRAGLPVSTFNGKTIFDSKGHPVFTPQSDISVIPSFEKKIIYGGKLKLYCCDDRPLLDVTGELLYTSRGVALLQLDKENVPKTDFNGRPVFDEWGIPVSCPGGSWKDQRDEPYRLFDKDGLPVTDPRGKELCDINGIGLIKRGVHGHPKYDRVGNILCDANGCQITQPEFCGTSVPPECNGQFTGTLLVSDFQPLRLYDLEGRPLTDNLGEPLRTIKGNQMLDSRAGLDKIVDFCGRTVYDNRKIPLACDPTIPVITMKGTPMVLYNKDGNPLMSLEGLPIALPDGSTILEFDEYGRPSKAGNSGLYDSCGVSIDSFLCNHGGDRTHQLSLMPIDGYPYHSLSQRRPKKKGPFRTVTRDPGSCGDNLVLMVNTLPTNSQQNIFN